MPIFLPVFAATIEKLGGMATKFSTRRNRTISLPVALFFSFLFLIEKTRDREVEERKEWRW